MDVSLALSLGAALIAGLPADVDLAPRTPVPKSPVVAEPLPDRPDLSLAQRLNVKFIDAAQARADDGSVMSRTGHDLDAVREVAVRHDLTFHPMVELSEEAHDAFRARVSSRSGTEQPDLLGILRIDVDDPTPQRLVAIGGELQALDAVEYVHVETVGVPPPGDIAPPTPDLSGMQGYHGPNPGLDVDYAITQGATGNGIRISDCEYGWVYSHEDLVDIDLHPEPGQTPHPNVQSFGWDEHGTAVVGETSAVVNAYGCRGIAPAAEVYTYPEWTLEGGFRRLAAITNAIAASDVGDIVLLEMQTGAGGPAELDPSIHLVCTMGVQAGVVVVGAAGNGNQNLDSGSYQSYQNLGDSGAIIVGAGTANTAHDKLSFSTFGQRVNVQGWGTAVFTLGYGSFTAYGGDKNQRYTDDFGGTSSASPFIAASAALLQQLAVDQHGETIDPLDLRDHLIATGIPQGSGGPIGPFPDLKAAIDGLDSLFPLAPWTDLGGGLAGTAGTPKLTGGGTLQAGTPFSLELTDARPLAVAALIVGTSQVDLQFYGGTLIPSPDFIVVFPQTSATGTLPLGGSTPAGIAPSSSLYFQYWIDDPVAVLGLAGSNGLRATAAP